MSTIFGIAKEEIKEFDMVTCKINPETGRMEVYKARIEDLELNDKDEKTIDEHSKIS
jgi:hypothetical protein